MTTSPPATAGPGPVAALRTPVLATVLLATGWLGTAVALAPTAAFASLGRLGAPLDVIVGVILMLLPFALGVVLLWTTPADAGLREAHAWCALLPAAAFAALAVFVVAPVFDWIASAWQPGAVFAVGPLAGMTGFGGALALGFALVVPLQFLGRRRGWPRTLVVGIGAGVPTALLVADAAAPAMATPIAWTCAAVLVGAALVAVEVARGVLEAEQGLRPPLVTKAAPGDNDAAVYDHRAAERTVGVALSGGGHRASLFGLGALMYVHEACAADPAARRVAAVASVSGGSITNGLAAHALALGVDDTAALDAMARRLIRHATRTGSMFSGLATRRGYWLLLAAASLLAVVAAWWWVRHLPWSVAWRAAAIVAMPFLAWVVIERLMAFGTRGGHRAGEAVASALGIILLVAAPFGLALLVAVPAWREAMAWLAATALALAALAALYTLRGRLIQRTFDALLRGDGPSPRLADARAATHHVFCATEAQFGETLYRASDRIRSRHFDDVAPGDLPTASAVRASAAFPGAFPPFFLRGVRGENREGVRGRADERGLRSEHMTLVDGGVRDNLGISWFGITPHDVDQVVVVSAAANRHALRAIARVVGIGELLALANIVNVPYNARERNRRRALRSEQFGRSWTRGLHEAAGALVHIEDSPYDLAWKVRAPPDPDAETGTRLDRSSLPEWDVDQWLAVERLRASAGRYAPVLLQRARAVLAHLDALEPRLPEPPPLTARDQLDLHIATSKSPLSEKWVGGSDPQQAWWLRTRVNTLVGTQLGRIAVRDAMNLVLHGYYLSMATLHLAAGWPLLDALDEARLGALFEGALDDPAARARTCATLEHAAAVARRRLPAREPLLVLWRVRVRTREAGDYRHDAAVLVLALDDTGRLRVLSAAIVPTWKDAGVAPHGDYGRFSAANQTMHADFWNGLVADLRRRGLADVGVVMRDTRVEHIVVPDGIEAIDAALRGGYPGARLRPRPAATAATLAGWFGSLDMAVLRADLEHVFDARDDAEGRQRLAAFATRWPAHPKLHDHLREGRDDLAALFASSPAERRLLADVDAELKALERRIGERIDARAPASGKPLALAELLDDVEDMLAAQPAHPERATAVRGLDPGAASVIA